MDLPIVESLAAHVAALERLTKENLAIKRAGLLNVDPIDKQLAAYGVPTIPAPRKPL